MTMEFKTIQENSKTLVEKKPEYKKSQQSKPPQERVPCGICGKDLAKGNSSPEQFVTHFSDELSNFLESKTEFQEETKAYFKHNPTKTSNVEEARKIKIALNKKAKEPEATYEDKANAKQSIRIHNHLMKLNK